MKQVYTYMYVYIYLNVKSYIFPSNNFTTLDTEYIRHCVGSGYHLPLFYLPKSYIYSAWENDNFYLFFFPFSIYTQDSWPFSIVSQNQLEIYDRKRKIITKCLSIHQSLGINIY